MTTKLRPKFNIISIFADLAIDLALIAFGVLVYYQFKVHEFLPLTINPFFTNLVGGKDNAVWIMAGVPFGVGVYNLVRLILRLLRGMAAANKVES